MHEIAVRGLAEDIIYEHEKTIAGRK